PLFDLCTLLTGGQTREPAGLLAAPDQRVVLEDDSVLSRVGVRPVEPAPVHLIANPLDRAPLALVLGRELIPERLEVVAHAAARGDVADELPRGRRSRSGIGLGRRGGVCSRSSITRR